MERQIERRETDMRNGIRLEMEVAQLKAAIDGSRVAPLTSVACDVCALRPHAAPSPSMLINRADTAPVSVVDEFDLLSPRGGDVGVASGSRGPPLWCRQLRYVAPCMVMAWVQWWRWS